MKFLKYLLFLLLIAIIGLAIYIAVQPNSFEVTRSRTISAPSTVIYDNVIDFKNWGSWSSWIKDNPDIKVELSENTKGVGSTYSWTEGNDQGTITTVAADPGNSISQKMQFEDMPASEITWSFIPNGDGTTEVTRKISGDNLPFMFKAYTALSGGMEEELGTHFERELESIDSIVVASMKEYSIKIDGITEYGGGFYVYKTTSATAGNISNMMAKQYAEILNFMGDNSIEIAGMPFTIYNEMKDNGSVIMSNAIPVKNRVIITDNSNILCDYMEKTKVLKATLLGDYSNLGEAWAKVKAYVKEHDLEPSDMKPFEIYTNDPGSTPNPADYKTEIYIPLKETVTEAL